MFHEVVTGHAEIGMRTASFAIVVPVAIYVAALWTVRERFCLVGWRLAILPVAALAVLLAPVLAAEALVPIAALLVVAAILRRAPPPPQEKVSAA